MPTTSIKEIRAQYPQYEDMSDEQLAKALHQKFYSDMDFAEFSKRVGLSQESSAPDEEARRGIVEEIGRQLGLTGRYIVEGATSIPAMVAQPIADVGDLILEGMGSDFRFGNQAQGVSNLLSEAGLPEPEGATERVIGDASRALSAGGAVTGVAKGVAGPVAAELAASPGLQAVSDVAGGTAQGVTREQGGGPIAQLAAGVAGGVSPAIAQRVAARPPAQPNELARLSAEHEVPLTVGETNQAPFTQKIETQLERLPLVGIRGFRDTQAGAAKTAAERLKNRFEGVDDVGEELQQSLRRVRDANKAEASKRFDVVEKLSQQTDEVVNPENSRRAAAELIAKEDALPAFQDDDLVRAVQDIASLPEMSFDVARKVRSRLLSAIRQAEKKAIGGNVSDEQVAGLNNLRAAFEKDIGDFAQRAGGNIEKAYRSANRYFRDKVVPFKERSLRKAASDDFDTDEILATFIKRDAAYKGRGKKAEKLVSNLDLKGKQAVKFALLSEAYEGALKGDTAFSPAKFAQEIKRLGDANNVVFTPQEQAELSGLVKVMEAAKRAGQYAENPPTGLRAADLGASVGIGALGVSSPAALVSLAGGVKGVSLLLTTRPGRALLVRANRAKRGSKEWEAVMQQANEEIGRIASRAAAVQGSQVQPATGQDQQTQ